MVAPNSMLDSRLSGLSSGLAPTGRRDERWRAGVLPITTYKAQVGALSEVLPGFRIGTVDEFQGQEAPISIYSMATSSSAEAPRGMQFLYSLNRLNVATSRVQCLAVVVANSDLPTVRCRTPRQITNTLARLFGVASGRAPEVG